MDWFDKKSPGLDVFQTLAQRALARMPQPFLDRLEGVPVRIEEFPDEDICADLALESPYDLLGLYQGIGLPAREGAEPAGSLPDMIFLYRRPILDMWNDGEESLGDLVAHVLIHEIGHHFGLSDSDMHALEAASAHEDA